MNGPVDWNAPSMRELRLVAVDEHGTHLILSDSGADTQHAMQEAGAQATARLPIDDRLRQVVSAGTTTPASGQTPQQPIRSTSAINVPSTDSGGAMSDTGTDPTAVTDLSPREIQARVRAGASVDELCSDSGMSQDRVVRYAAPVLAEREHIIGRARRAHLRRLSTAAAEPGAESGAESGPIELDDAVNSYAAAAQTEQDHRDEVTWDS